MVHIYLYVHDLRSSGVVRNAIALAARMAREHPTTLIAGHGEGFFVEAARQGPFELAILAQRARPPFPRYRVAWRLRRWLQRRPGGVLVSMGNLGHRSVIAGCRGLSHIRRIYRISNELQRTDGLLSLLRRRRTARLIKDADRVAVVGASLARVPLIANAIARGAAVPIPNGVDAERARSLAGAPCPHPWLDDEVPVVLGIGRLRPQKDFDLLIAGVERARRARRVRLVILGVGTADERTRLGELAASLGEDFLLAGETDNVFAWLARAGVFCLSSRWEGSSMALLEALAVGTPVVAAREAGDAAQVLGEGRFGLLLDRRDPEVLADLLLRQLSSERVTPGERIADYGVSLDAYADLILETANQPQRAAGIQR
jgi:glycosyltransferase involved in cell wall biosynthesis